VTNATTKVTTVTIAPNEKLRADATYYLQLALSKTVGTAPVWEVTATDGDPGIHGPVYVEVENDVQSIAFRTVSTFKVRTSAGTLTNLDALSFTSTAATEIKQDGNIIIEFDRPIATVGKAQLRFYRGTEYYGTTVSAGTLSPDKTVLTIAPTNLLAPDETFVVRLNVTSVDGQQIVYDSTNPGDPSAWANPYAQDLHIETENPADVRLTGVSKPTATGGTLVLTPAGAVPRANTDLDLTFTVTAAGVANFGQEYFIYGSLYDVWDPDEILDDVEVLAGATVPSVAYGGNPVNVDIPGNAPHFTGQNIQFKARGVNNLGYVSEATSAIITFQTTP
jgi:hypothetical protein